MKFMLAVTMGMLTILVAVLGTVTADILSGLPREFAAPIAAYFLFRVTIVALMAGLTVCLARSAWSEYCGLPDTAKARFHRAVSPVVDLGLREAGKREDGWGKAARCMRRAWRAARRPIRT